MSDVKTLFQCLIKELKELDSYDVSIGNDSGPDGNCSYLYSERNIDGSWINSYDLESIIQRYEELLPVFENDVSDEEMKSLFGEDWKQINV